MGKPLPPKLEANTENHNLPKQKPKLRNLSSNQYQIPDIWLSTKLQGTPKGEHTLKRQSKPQNQTQKCRTGNLKYGKDSNRTNRQHARTDRNCQQRDGNS